MTRISKVLQVLVAATALASALATPSYTWAAGRADAVHESSVRAGKFIEHSWGDTEIYQYRACMAEYGQPE
jgi:hypothetical protein